MMIPLIPSDSGGEDPVEEIVGTTTDEVVLAVTSPINYFPLYVNTLKMLLKTEQTGVCVTFNRSAKAVADVLKKEGVDISRLYFVDCISKVSGVRDEGERTEYAESPSALSSIGIAVNASLEKTGGGAFIVYDSIPTLLIYNDLEDVLQFTDYIINKMREKTGKTVIFAVEEGDVKLMNHLMQSCDKVVKT